MLDLCRRFNLRFTVIHDRWDSQVYGNKTIEDLKERYYSIANVINRVRVEPGHDPPKAYNFDADHEKRRKEQLSKLWSRTQEQVEEEEFLRAEIKKIEARKREREKKTQDLQKLITAADAGSLADTSMAPPGTPGIGNALNKKNAESRRAAILSAKKKTGKALQTLRGRDSLGAASVPDVFQGIKWPEFKTAGAFVRSQKMKLPGSVGQKKLKALELILQKLNVELIQIPTEEIVAGFNELRSDIVLLYELKSMLAACDMEIQSTMHQFEHITGQKLEIPEALLAEASSLIQSFETGGPGRSSSTSAAVSSLAASLAVNDLDLPSVSWTHIATYTKLIVILSQVLGLLINCSFSYYRGSAKPPWNSQTFSRSSNRKFCKSIMVFIKFSKVQCFLKSILLFVFIASFL